MGCLIDLVEPDISGSFNGLELLLPEVFTLNSWTKLEAIKITSGRRTKTVEGGCFSALFLTSTQTNLRTQRRVVFMDADQGKGRAFCAGGDVAAVVRDISGGRPFSFTVIVPCYDIGNWKLGAEYFQNEFTLNYLMATYSKTQVSILNGIVMGGGAGASIHGRFRVATENSVFAMPETALGLFPDVGASYYLSRLPGFFVSSSQVLEKVDLSSFIPLQSFQEELTPVFQEKPQLCAQFPTTNNIRLLLPSTQVLIQNDPKAPQFLSNFFSNPLQIFRVAIASSLARGEYVGLTGARLDGAEMLACGLATHFVPSERRPPSPDISRPTPWKDALLRETNLRPRDALFISVVSRVASPIREASGRFLRPVFSRVASPVGEGSGHFVCPVVSKAMSPALRASGYRLTTVILGWHLLFEGPQGITLIARTSNPLVPEEKLIWRRQLWTSKELQKNLFDLICLNFLRQGSSMKRVSFLAVSKEANELEPMAAVATSLMKTQLFI
ncbi:hypothetical protein RJ639_034444 [Escallonia herrerae]|uniref:3-hydroxyisobutyryl-CoA hydrolase n=1 Tax=Escallonia herrerae TaxID=1293975 RepID=A0AA89B9V0_9ASTE|nr:hypothetical protein RJ639_034444 [Escallonia herrerae]